MARHFSIFFATGSNASSGSCASRRNAFVDFIAANPSAGDVVPDTGGLRKIRWGRPGIGKRGGVRVIYFYHEDSMPLYLLPSYAKAVRENWTRDARQRAQALTGQIKQTYRRH